jgi:hypothetical protein
MEPSKSKTTPIYGLEAMEVAPQSSSQNQNQNKTAQPSLPRRGSGPSQSIAPASDYRRSSCVPRKVGHGCKCTCTYLPYLVHCTALHASISIHLHLPFPSDLFFCLPTYYLPAYQSCIGTTILFSYKPCLILTQDL